MAVLPKWLRKWEPETPQAAWPPSRSDSWRFHSRKQLIGSSETPITSLSLIAQYVVGSLAFGAQMMWSMENLTMDERVTTVFTELIPCTKRGGVWPDDMGRPVVFYLYELTDTAIRWFYAAHARGQIDPMVRALLRTPMAMPLPRSHRTTRCTVVPDITAERPTPSLRELCAFLERVTSPDSLPHGRIYLPTSGWPLDDLLDCPPVVAMVRGLYDVVHVEIETSTRQIRWLLASNPR